MGGDGMAARVTATCSARLSYEGEGSRDDNGPAWEGVGPEEGKGEGEKRVAAFFLFFSSFASFLF